MLLKIHKTNKFSVFRLLFLRACLQLLLLFALKFLLKMSFC
ncbi:indole-3-glycerol phosphate synthase [Listeria monocytogenes]|nr:indole-3-glycerol phosphate synthase [Listeria monocytogenes]GAT38959.1 indole-3-glycerol phosphate synthase [Listeria monocytogenes]